MAMTLRTDAELDAALTALAERSGISKQEVVRRAVLREHEAQSHRQVVESAGRRVMQDYSEALDRLGSV